MSVYQVLVVDDSAFMRKIITDLIQQDPSFKVTDTASTGAEAVQKAHKIRPDLITMDVEMPEMNGLEALKLIMAEHPIPIIMLSGINESGLKETIMALEAGAFDFIRKPSIQNKQDIFEVGAELRNQMKEAMLMIQRKAQQRAAVKEETASERILPVKETPVLKKPGKDIASYKPKLESPVVQEAKPILREATKTDAPAKRPAQNKSDDIDFSNRAKPAEPKAKEIKSLHKDRKPIRPVSIEKQAQETTAADLMPVHKEPVLIPKEAGPFTQLVAIGCSTGGPRALKTVLSQIPRNFEAPIVIVQHMPPDFTRSLASRLDSFSEINVVEAEEGMVLKAGTAYIAPGGYHMRVREKRHSEFEIVLGSEDPVNGHRPSVDTLFESLIPLNSLERHIAILTGMGSDGARMMKRLYETGVTSTFAESEETCVVYGMPRAAAELGCVNELLPLEELTDKMVRAVTKKV
ncbi:chemotaxis-specific protein-glutamate methyltransferase CheB [Neobacillus mesonae]|nr:chemotaxis-specific protein-glutamate methyltransferase CheB [Neobacillus mesonae]